MEHNKALAKIKEIYKAKDCDIDATALHIRGSNIFTEWHDTDYGLVVRTTDSEFNGILVGHKNCPGTEFFGYTVR